MEEIIAGKHAVLEALRSGRTVNKIWLAQGSAPHQLQAVVEEAKKLGVMYQFVDRRKLDQMVDKDIRHQGVVAQAAPYEYADLEDLFQAAKERGEAPFFVILDEIEDPHNLGSILRTSLFLGASAVGITRHGSAPLSPVTLKASSGAAESLPLFIIPSLPHFLTTTRQNGWTVFAACARDPSVRKNRRHWDLDDVRREEPLRKGGCVLVLGSEGEGLERATVKKADYEVAVPGGGGAAQRVGVESLNVGVAAGLVVEAFMGGVLKAKEGSSGSGELW